LLRNAGFSEGRSIRALGILFDPEEPRVAATIPGTVLPDIYADVDRLAEAAGYPDEWTLPDFEDSLESTLHQQAAASRTPDEHGSLGPPSSARQEGVRQSLDQKVELSF
jgi:hypothetical protein